MAVNYAALVQKIQATPLDTQSAGASDTGLSFSELEKKYGGGPVATLDTTTPTTIQTGAPAKPGGFFTGVARAVAPLGDAIGSALGTFGAKKMEADTAKRQEELSNVAISLIRNKNLSADQKARALKALQISQDTGVISQSGAFDLTGRQVAGQALGTLGSLTAGGGSALAGKLGLKGAAGVAARALGEGVVGGTTFGLGGALQEGKTNKELAPSILTAAVASGAFGLAGEGLGAGLEFLSQKVPSRAINALIRTKANDFRFGKNPGGQIVEEGITANTKGGFLKAINTRRQQVGEELGAALRQATESGTTVDFSKALSPLEEAKSVAIKRGERALYQRLKDLEEGLTGIFQESNGGIERVGSKNLHRLTPEQGRLIKTDIGGSTTWTGQAFDKDINKVRVQIYQEMDRLIDQAVPSAKKLNERYANLLTAQKALEKTIANAEGQNLIRLNTLLTGLGAAGGAATGDSTGDRALRGLAGAGLAATLRSPAAITRFAQIAKRAGPATSVGGKATVEALKRLALGSLQSTLK